MKIAIIIPDRRVWRWHADLVAFLRQSHTVDVFARPSEPYPWALRTLLRVERILFGSSRLAEAIPPATVCPQIKPSPALVEQNYDFTLDLAAGGTSRDQAHLTYDGSGDELQLFGTLLARRSPVLAVRYRDEVVSSYAAIDDREVLSRALSSAF